MAKQLFFTADDELARAIDKIAGTMQRSRSETICLLLQKQVEASTRKPTSFDDVVNSSGGTGVAIRAIYETLKPKQRAMFQDTFRKLMEKNYGNV
jgi:ABC-type transporter MlaC component